MATLVNVFMGRRCLTSKLLINQGTKLDEPFENCSELQRFSQEIITLSGEVVIDILVENLFNYKSYVSLITRLVFYDIPIICFGTVSGNLAFRDWWFRNFSESRAIIVMD